MSSNKGTSSSSGGGSYGGDRYDSSDQRSEATKSVGKVVVNTDVASGSSAARDGYNPAGNVPTLIFFGLKRNPSSYMMGDMKTVSSENSSLGDPAYDYDVDIKSFKNFMLPTYTGFVAINLDPFAPIARLFKINTFSTNGQKHIILRDNFEPNSLHPLLATFFGDSQATDIPGYMSQSFIEDSLGAEGSNSSLLHVDEFNSNTLSARNTPMDICPQFGSQSGKLLVLHYLNLRIWL